MLDGLCGPVCITVTPPAQAPHRSCFSGDEGASVSGYWLRSGGPRHSPPVQCSLCHSIKEGVIQEGVRPNASGWAQVLGI